MSKTLVGVTDKTEELPVYFPELYLCQWLKTQGEETTIWCLKKTGVVDLLNNYLLLINYLQIDGILLVDGGVDSLIRGDEQQLGTVAEDSLSLAVVGQLEQIPLRLITCLGMGAERDISYGHILENIAYLTAMDGFLGSCSLVKKMLCYQKYEQAVMYVQSKPEQESSVINSSIISAVQGHYGDYHFTSRTHGSELLISPLMSIYWFFDLSPVVSQNLFLPQLLRTKTFPDVLREILQIMADRVRRPPGRIFLSYSSFHVVRPQ